MTAPALSATGLSFAFGDLTVVDEVSLSIERGSLTAVVGPNGAGKTTLLELLAGLRCRDAGQVDRPDGARSVAYLPQSPAFRPGFTARETVGHYTALADADETPGAYLERVGLGAAADRRVEALSGGMTRLLGIAQALVGDPPVVVLDEPTSGLDPEMADRIFGIAGELTDDDRAVLVASHDLAGVERHASRVLFFADGGVGLDGTPGEVCEATGTEALREAFSAATSRTATATEGDEP